MNTRWITLFLLTAVVAGLVAVVILEPGREKTPGPIELTDLQAGAINSIRIERPDQQAIVMQKSAAGWKLTAPLALAANTFRIEKLLEITTAKAKTRFSSTSIDRAALQLEPPRAQLTLNDTVFSFGGTDAIDQLRYVETGGEVFLTVDKFYHHLIAGPNNWMSRYVLEDKAEPVAIELPELSLRLTDGRWMLSPPDETVGADAINTLVRAWREAQAIDIRPLPEIPDAAPYIRVERAGLETIGFRLLTDQADHLLARPDKHIAYLVSGATADSLLKLAEPESNSPEEVTLD